MSSYFLNITEHTLASDSSLLSTVPNFYHGGSGNSKLRIFYTRTTLHILSLCEIVWNAIDFRFALKTFASEVFLKLWSLLLAVIILKYPINLRVFKIMPLVKWNVMLKLYSVYYQLQTRYWSLKRCILNERIYVAKGTRKLRLFPFYWELMFQHLRAKDITFQFITPKWKVRGKIVNFESTVLLTDLP